MDRNIDTIKATVLQVGQARKSLWIETSFSPGPPVIIAGQARKSLWIETPEPLWTPAGIVVRLVRACGSKLRGKTVQESIREGQARKSLWIETLGKSYLPTLAGVRLVRACGSKQ